MKTQTAILGYCVAMALAGCSRPKEDSLFKFPVEKLRDIDYTAAPASSLLQDDMLLAEFKVVDSAVISYLVMENEFLSVSFLNQDTPPLRLCRKGRGPGEFAVMAPPLDYYNGHLTLFDLKYRKYYSLDLQQSIDSAKTVISREVQMVDTTTAIWPLLSAFQTGNDSLLLHTSKKMEDPPQFYLMDLKSGEQLREYAYFSKGPRSLFKSIDCINPERNVLFSAMIRIPQINYLDLRTGSIKGFRLEGRPRLNRDKQYLYFMSVSTYQDLIYALYSGEREIDYRAPQSPSTLYVFDWEGNIRAKYLLDDAYLRCSVSEDGTIYLSKLREDGAEELWCLAE